MATTERRPYPTDPSAISVRVDNLADDVHGFRVEMRGMQQSMATKDEIAQLAGTIQALAADMKAARTPNWQAMGVGVTVLALIGGMLWWPIREVTQDLKSQALRGDTLTIDNKVYIARLEERINHLTSRYDAISNRLAELIRTGK